MDKVTILNVTFDNLTMKEAIQLISEKGGVVCTPNVDHLIKLQKCKPFYDIVKKADFVLCDSQIIVICSRFLGKPIKERIAGSDFFREFYMFNAKNERIKIFLLGGDTQEIANKAMENINKRVNRKIVVGAFSPPFGFEKDRTINEKIINLINNSDASVLVVGIGAPKQEKWIWENKEKLKKIKLFLALGATINMEAGIIKRPPKIISKIGFEWFFRMLQDPKRLIKRYLVDDMPFFYLIVKEKLGKYKNPFEKGE